VARVSNGITGRNKELPFEIDTLDPRYAFVVYNNGFGRKPLMGVKYIQTEDNELLFSIYTRFEYFEVKSSEKGWAIVEQSPHALGDIPIIEYPANTSRLGSFEVVLGLLNAINDVTSNRMDGIEQFVQAFMKFVNCEIDEETFLKFKELGAIKSKVNRGIQPMLI